MASFGGLAGRAPLVIQAAKTHTATVIMAHGLGDSGLGWVSLAQNWRRRGTFDNVKFIFPNAPNIPITVNMGMEMPGWYDIVRLRNGTSSLSEIDQGDDEPGVLKSRSYFNGLIEDEIKNGIPSEKIILGGFSQGGAMSLFTGLTVPHKLGGVFGLSSYLLLRTKIKDFIKESSAANQDTPFFMGHGDADEVVKYKFGQMTAKVLKEELGQNIEFKTYRGTKFFRSNSVTGRLWVSAFAVADRACGYPIRHRLGQGTYNIIEQAEGQAKMTANEV